MTVAKYIMIQGTSSGAGKSILVAALCRILSDLGYTVAPFKSQNMSRYSYSISNQQHLEISSAQAIQAAAARCQITSELNPILLKPQIQSMSSVVYVNGAIYGTMDATTYYSEFVLSRGFNAASKALESLSAKHDIIILEGAGSPVEINLTKYDIANMKMAHLANDAPVIVVCDIDRGGAFASLAGTMALLSADDARLVRGFVLNKFRGDIEILKPGYDIIYDKTNVPILGTIPMLDLSDLPDEDSLDSRADAPHWGAGEIPPQIERGLTNLAKNVKMHLNIEQILEMIS